VKRGFAEWEGWAGENTASTRGGGFAFESSISSGGLLPVTPPLCQPSSPSKLMTSYAKINKVLVTQE